MELKAGNKCKKLCFLKQIPAYRCMLFLLHHFYRLSSNVYRVENQLFKLSFYLSPHSFQIIMFVVYFLVFCTTKLGKYCSSEGIVGKSMHVQ